MRPLCAFLRGAAAAAATLLVLAGCNYPVPITARPTRAIEPALLGDWLEDGGRSRIQVRRLDDSTYVGTVDEDFVRAFHSDTGPLPLLSVQDLESAERRYIFVAWALYDDGRRLGIRTLNSDIIPQEITASAAVRELIRQNLSHPQLFDGDEEFFLKQP